MFKTFHNTSTMLSYWITHPMQILTSSIYTELVNYDSHYTAYIPSSNPAIKMRLLNYLPLQLSGNTEPYLYLMQIIDHSTPYSSVYSYTSMRLIFHS